MNLFKKLFSPKESYHTEDSKLMLQLELDKFGYRVAVTALIKARIESCEHFGYPPLGVY
jgi:hypothetical protein